MGYCTLYGDMAGGLSVISDVTKKQVYALARWINRNEEIIPQATIDKTPSAELKPNQKDTDSLFPNTKLSMQSCKLMSKSSALLKRLRKNITCL